MDNPYGTHNKTQHRKLIGQYRMDNPYTRGAQDTEHRQQNTTQKTDWTIHIHVGHKTQNTDNKTQHRKLIGQYRMDNPYTRGAQDTEHRQQNTTQKTDWTIHIHVGHKTQNTDNKTQHRKLIGQYRMDNPYTRGAQDTGRRQQNTTQKTDWTI